MHVYLEWRCYYKFSQLFAINEYIIKFDGRLDFKQYIKNKPVKWGIKGYLLYDSINGYCYKASIYSGKKRGITCF